MVSVIIPYYNRPEKILRCVKSVLAQTYQNFEILIIDDYSKDPLSLDLDPRIQIFRNESNKGPGGSRNVGLDHAQGKYIAFLDSDDYWHKDFLQITYNNLVEDNSLAFVYTQTNAFIGSVIRPYRKDFEKRSRVMPEILIRKRVWTTPSCLWNFEKIGDIRYLDSRNWEDYVFNVEVSLRANKIKYIDQVLCFCDKEGDDKLTRSDFHLRLQEKSYSIVKLFDVLENTSYLTQKPIKEFFRNELLTALEFYSKFNGKLRVTSTDILKRLKQVVSSVDYFMIYWTYKLASDKISYTLLNKIKKKR